jgi:hypothetical protein
VNRRYLWPAYAFVDSAGFRGFVDFEPIGFGSVRAALTLAGLVLAPALALYGRRAREHEAAD